MKKRLIYSLLTGLLFAAALPPFKTGFFAYAALIPFFLLLEDLDYRSAFKWGYITGLSIDIFSLFWIAWVTKAGFVGAILILPLYYSIYAILYVFLVKHLKLWAFAVLPFVWTFIEYIQSISEIAFPWTFLGYTQTYYLPWIQFAEYTSVFGVSFWVALLNIILYFIYKNRQNRQMILKMSVAFVLIFILPAVYGYWVMAHPIETDKQIRVGMVQGNIDPFEKWNNNLYEKNYSVYSDLSHELGKQNIDLLVWPETATPFYLRYERKYLKRIYEMVDSLNISFITGTVDFEYDTTGGYVYYNSALGIQPKHSYIQRYAKMLLVPFSERVPYAHYFPFNILKKALYDFALGIGSYSKGEKIKLFSFTKDYNSDHGQTGYRYKVATSICYESVFPDHIRNMTNQGADLLTIITNDAWFGKTSAPFQHAQFAAFRAIENRISIARCANTGISCFIDPYGRISNQTPIYQTKAISGNVALLNKDTFYETRGNIFAKFSALVTLLSVLVALIILLKEKVFGKS